MVTGNAFESLTTEPVRSIEIFFSFAHEDIFYRNELEKHLSILKRQGQIVRWSEREVYVDKEWAYEVDPHINQAQIILLLVSPDFMNSDYCYSIEMKRALERHRIGEARVIPIILRSVYWQDAPFSKLQSLPTDGRPVKRWPDLDEAFFDIVTGISGAIKELTATYKFTEGDALSKSKRYDEALTAYEQALLLNPHSSHAYNGKGNVLYKLKRYDDALAAYEYALSLDPANILIYCNKGNVFLHLGRFAEALAAYEQAILLDAYNPLPFSSPRDAQRACGRANY